MKTLLYGLMAFVVFPGTSFIIDRQVNRVPAAAAAPGVMIAHFFAAPWQGR
ncbi:MAG: hypothetical protein WBJ06_07990 [Candidatus Methanoculleus thermohydrogenotrophicum]|jgi:hypothetical protein|nr:hypothetical protein [Candidatus Methanoculleus thermohydrogenotrophicum]HPZ37249.1 hypothetical protein [Candidatus Methanoculleus thermohydrogenotrophicum]HQC90537.1 hypothetical protein [Candidatus Methanoculleus thermohydrogenotrophicum]